MDIKKIKKLIKMVEKSEINELTIEEEGFKITIRKGEIRGENRIDVKGAEIEELPVSEEKTEEVKGYPGDWKEIAAPLVGTFYRASHPDASPFVEEGDEIEEGQTVCILEAMKLMNEIKIEEPGIMKKILVKNGYSVEYGQVLFLYEPK